MENIKICQVCKKELIRRKNERKIDFIKRKCCSHQCAGAMPNVEGRTHQARTSIKFVSYTRYGGSRLNIKKEHLEKWNCQLCGLEQTDYLPEFLYEVFPQEYIRVCGTCYCQSKLYDSFEEIKKLSKTIANYVTYELKPFYGQTTNFKSSFISLSTLDRR